MTQVHASPQIESSRLPVLMGHYLARNSSTRCSQVQVPRWHNMGKLRGSQHPHICGITLTAHCLGHVSDMVNLLHGYLYINAARTHDQVKIYYQ